MTASPTRNRRPEERNGPAEIRKDDQKGSGGTYSFPALKATHEQVRMKFRVYRGLEKIRRRKRRESGEQAPKFRRPLLRMREIERLIRHRYGDVLPAGYGEEYLLAMAHALNVSGVDVHSTLRNWCGRFAPWLTREFNPILADISAKVKHRVFDLRADAAARLLNLTLSERQDLKIRTIGACDVSPAELRAIMKERKMQQDRERQRANRKAEGRKDRARYEAESLSRQKPWEAEGISRRTWERRRVASVSRVDSSIQIGDTLASTAATAVDERPQAAQAAIRHDSDSVPLSAEPHRRRAAQRSGAEGQCERMRAHPAEIKAVCAALDFFHAHNAAGGRWKPAPGSATEFIAA